MPKPEAPPTDFMAAIRNASAASRGPTTGNGAPLPDQRMEALGLMLDELEKKDPAEYKRLMTELASQMSAGAGKAVAQPPEQGGCTAPREGEIVMPGTSGQVLGKDGKLHKRGGIRAIEVTPTPGFVIKTRDSQQPVPNKIFINVVTSDKIKAMSQRKQLDENGEEQEGVHVPCSINPPREDKDKAGKPCTVYDVMLNTHVLDDIRADLTGGFKQWICSICVEHVERKFKLTGARALDRRFKFPKLHYKGEGVVSTHRIKAPEEQTPSISEVAGGTQSQSKVGKKGNRGKSKKKKGGRQGGAAGGKTRRRAQREDDVPLPYIISCSSGRDVPPDEERKVDPCFGALFGESNSADEHGLGTPYLCPTAVPRWLIVRTTLDRAKESAHEVIKTISVSVSAWTLVIDAQKLGYRRLELPLPLPVLTEAPARSEAPSTQPVVEASFDPTFRVLELRMCVDREAAALLRGDRYNIIESNDSDGNGNGSDRLRWGTMSRDDRLRIATEGLREGEGPDVGSRQWLLAQALKSDNQIPDSSGGEESKVMKSREHERARERRSGNGSDSEDDDLPEDRFHRADIMSRYLIDEKKKSRAKAKEEEREREAKRQSEREKDGLDDLQRMKKQLGIDDAKGKDKDKDKGKDKEHQEESVVLLDDPSLGSGTISMGKGKAKLNVGGIQLENQYYLDLL